MTTVNERRFYVYAYMRADGTPYYIGRGTGKRMHNKNHNVALPPYERRIVLMEALTTQEADEWEMDLISILGRKQHGGCLRNLTDGGGGAVGTKHSPEHKAYIKNYLIDFWAANPEKNQQRLLKAVETRKRTWSPEKAERAAAAQRGKTMTAEARANMKEAQARRLARETSELRAQVKSRAAATKRANGWDSRLREMGHEIPECPQERARLINRIKLAKARRAKGIQEGVRRGADIASARLNEEKVRMIKASSASSSSLAKQLGVTVQSICNVRNGVTWAHVH